MQRLECVNKINAEYIMVRASSPNNDTLKIDYDIYIQGGISKKNSNYQHIPPKRHGLTLGLEAWMRSRSGRKKCGRREGLNNRPLTD